LKAIDIYLVTEDEISEFLSRRILESIGGKFCIYNSIVAGGWGKIKKNIRGYNSTAKSIPFLVLTDLDTTECPNLLIREWLPGKKNHNLMFRVAVKEIESWLLADRRGFSSFFKIHVGSIPINTDLIQDPKLFLMNLVKKSRSRDIIRDICPRNDNAVVGPNYNGRLKEFVYKKWDVEGARKNSESLNRLWLCLNNFTPTAAHHTTL